jgi:hypothetical protein
VAHGYFAAMGIELIQGREFTADESRFGTRPALVVNETLARRYLGSSAVGRRVRMGAEDDEAPWMTVVGVVRDTYVGSRSGGIGLDPAPVPQMYVSWGVAPYSSGTLLVSSENDPTALAAAVRELLRDVGPTVPLYNASPLDERIAETTWAFGLFGTVFTVFGLLALVLSAVGLYGVMAFSVAQHRREMSVRMALGAHAGSIMASQLTEAGRRVALGVGAGFLLSLFVGRGLRALLFGVEPFDLAVNAVVLATVAGTGLLAALVPALRAARTEPAESLGR